MVTLTNHGGHCCGARHLYSFGENENRNPESIVTELAKAPVDRMIEVILNGTQVADYPAILAKLDELGFVLDGHWINGNHNSHNYRFSRCDKRQALTAGPINPNWRGMVMTPEIDGNLPRVPGQNNEHYRHAPYVRPVPRWARQIALQRERLFANGNNSRARATGALYRINSPRSQYHNQEFRCIGRDLDFRSASYHLFFRNTAGVRFSIVENNCVRLNGPEQAQPDNIRDFQVGDRVQIRLSWDNYPVGLLGFVTDVRAQHVQIQVDTPNSRPVTSCYQFIHLVDFDRQPEIPRKRIVVEPVVEPLVVQRHTNARLANGEVIEAPAPVPVVPFVVWTTFHCVSADGTRGAGFDTLLDARNNLGRRTRIDRRNIMSDGSVLWYERVE